MEENKHFFYKSLLFPRREIQSFYEKYFGLISLIAYIQIKVRKLIVHNYFLSMYYVLGTILITINIHPLTAIKNELQQVKQLLFHSLLF